MGLRLEGYSVTTLADTYSWVKSPLLQVDKNDKEERGRGKKRRWVDRKLDGSEIGEALLYLVNSEDSISLFRHWMERFGSKIGKVFDLWLLD